MINKQNQRSKRLAIIVAVLLCGGLQACSFGSGSRPGFSGGYSNDGPGKLPKAKHLKDAKPQWEERTRAGNAPKYTVLGKTYYTLDTAQGYRRRGTASWYGRKFHGKKTANGEIYDMYSMSAAHKSLPIPSYVRVRNLSNGREAIVRINDRGPFVDDREIDLSFAAAIKLGVYDTGTAAVEVTGIEVTRRGKVSEAAPLAKAQAPQPSAPPFSEQADAAAKIAMMERQADNHQSTQNTEALAPSKPLQAEEIADSSIVNQAAITEQWWVQAGAFNILNGANSLSLKLHEEGFPNTVIDAHQGDLPYKVRVGPFLMETHARWAQLSLDERGLNKGFVVQTGAP